jgi:hypothetical protein
MPQTRQMVCHKVADIAQPVSDYFAPGQAASEPLARPARQATDDRADLSRFCNQRSVTTKYVGTGMGVLMVRRRSSRLAVRDDATPAQQQHLREGLAADSSRNLAVGSQDVAIGVTS